MASYSRSCRASWQEVVEGVQATGKRGKLTIVLELAPAKAGMFVLTDDVKQVIPEPERDTTTVFFVTQESDLSRRDPRQPKLPEMGPRGVVAPIAAGGDGSRE
jgi:hypothetical protein